MTSPRPVTLILADDHPLFMEGIHSYLKRKEGYNVIGIAGTGLELVELVGKLKPDVVVTDIQMPRIDGIAATKKILKDNSDAKIIAMSFLDSEYAVVDMLEAGAMGYLYKGGDPQELLDAIESVNKGEYYFSLESKPQLIKKIAESNYKPFKLRECIDFSERELEIIKLLCKEVYVPEIADTLKISKRTVETHIQNIYRKIGTNNICGLFAFAIRNSIVVIPNHQSQSLPGSL